MPSTCAGTRSTTAPNSTGCPTCVPPCDWCRRLPAGPHVPRAPAAIDAIDHVMTYFFSDLGGMKGFLELSRALGDAGRKLPLLPPVERGSTTSVKRQPLRGSRSVPTCCRGGRPEGCTCCWRPTRRRRHSWPTSMASRVSGLPRRGWSTPDWRARLRARCISYYFLDEDPVLTAERLRPAFETRWSDQGIAPLSPPRFTPSCPMSGIAMCRRRFRCGSA